MDGADGRPAVGRGGVLCMSIGDGSTPRAAGLASFLTSWHTVSIDPSLRQEWTGPAPNGVVRLHGVSAKLEDFMQRPDLIEQIRSAAAAGTSEDEPGGGGGGGGGALSHLLLLCVHAHHRFRGPASLAAIRAAFGDPATTCVALPCCPTFNPTKDIGRQPDHVFDDRAIFSECRRLHIWRWAAGIDQIASSAPSVALQNACNFLLANAARVATDGWRPDTSDLSTTNILDKWLLLSLRSMLHRVQVNAAAGRPHDTVAQEVADYIELLTNWHIRLNRGRAGGAAGPTQQSMALSALYTVLMTMTMTLRDCSPFVSERMHQSLRTPQWAPPEAQLQAMHRRMTSDLWPTDGADSRVGQAVASLQDAVACGRKIRDKHNRPNKLPLLSATIVHADRAAGRTGGGGGQPAAGAEREECVAGGGRWDLGCAVGCAELQIDWG